MNCKIASFVLLLATFWGATWGSAQIKIDVDEAVKVPTFSGEWVDGVVVAKKRGEYLVDYSAFGGGDQEVFKRKQIRKLYEFEGLDFGRMWESADGKFKIEASLLRYHEDSIDLINSEMDEVSVPLSKLSEKDVNYVKKFKKLVGEEVKRGIRPAVIPALPEIENFGGAFGAGAVFNEAAKSADLDLKPIPKYLREFKQAGVGYNLIRGRQRLVATMPIGGPEQLVLMSFRERNPFESGENFQSQLYWVSLKKKKVTDFVSIAHEDYAIDYNPQHKLLLTFNRSEEFIGQIDEPDHYTVWRLKPGAGTATPIVRFAGKGMDWAETLFGKVVNDRVVVVKTDRSTYQAFDIKEKKSAYVLNTKSFFDAPVVITHDRKHLVIPEDGSVSIVNAATGDVVFTDYVDDRHVSGANVNESGTKLAAVSERSIYVWDLQSSSPEPKRYPAPLMGSPFSSRVEWVDDDHLLGESEFSRVLYKLSLKLAIWSYEMEVFQYFLNSDPNTNMVIDGKFFYVARPPNLFDSFFAVGCVDLPGPGVEQTIASVDRDSLMIVAPGKAMALDVSGSVEPDKVRGWLLSKFEENGWVYDQNAELVMTATTEIGKSKRVVYEEWGGGKRTNVTFKAHSAHLKIMKGDLIVWQSGTSTGPPPTVQLEEGQTVQGEVDKYAKPPIGFFNTVRLEPDIVDPKYSRGFGKSELGLRGIRVVSTQPPGRENDPLAAARQAAEDRRKAAEEEGKNKGTEGSSNSNGLPEGIPGLPDGLPRGPGVERN